MKELNKVSVNAQGVIGKTGLSIIDYFNKINELHKSGELCPVNLDEVWMLCYSEKGKAVRALLDNYIENEDYLVFAQNGKNPKGGRSTQIYKLSVSCLEHFIARKVKEVFEVYRQVFHAKMEKQLTLAEIVLKQAENAVMQEQRTTVLENKVLQLEAKTTTTPDYFTVVGYAIGNHVKIGLQMAAKIGARAKALCKQQGIPVESIPDPRFGKVGMYPKSVLAQAFDTVQF